MLISAYAVIEAILPIFIDKFGLVGTGIVGTSFMSIAMGWWTISLMTGGLAVEGRYRGDEEYTAMRKRKILEAFEEEAKARQEALDLGISWEDIQRSRKYTSRNIQYPFDEDLD